ncbi:MAG: sigma-70 family RNA polymerase sigma factor [Acidobacteria bacterium]|nr:sigma-70 family RNA polymerase sigma factor [Acidobacteriota bacterium]
MPNVTVNVRQMDDIDLVALAREGDEPSFQELVRRHYDRAYKQALSILRNEEEAHDEVQNAFLKIWKSLGQFQGNSKLSTWIARIVVNQCLMRLRQLNRARLVYLEDTADGEDRAKMDLVDPTQTPEAATGEREVRQLVHREIGRIPALLRRVFIRHYLDGVPLQQVADEMNLTLGATKSRLLRARAELRERLAKHCGTMGAATLLS